MGGAGGTEAASEVPDSTFDSSIGPSGVNVGTGGPSGGDGTGGAQLPVGYLLLVERFRILSGTPGFGKYTSKPSSVPQSLSILATNISGNEARPEPPLVMVTAAQFIYISRFPTLLNQDHAKSTSPDFVSLGTLNVKEPPLWRGQDPIYDSITLKVTPLSSEIDAWHDPPS